MRLELHKVHIKGLDFAEKTHVKNGVLYVNKEEAEALVAEDRNFSKVSIDLPAPVRRRASFRSRMRSNPALRSARAIISPVSWLPWRRPETERPSSLTARR